MADIKQAAEMDAGGQAGKVRRLVRRPCHAPRLPGDVVILLSPKPKSDGTGKSANANTG